MTVPAGFPDTFESSRLRFRRPTADDAAAIFRSYAQDPEVTRYLTWAPHRHVEDTEDFLETCDTGWQRGSPLTWVIELRTDRAVIGMFGCRLSGRRCNIGYVLARPHWGKGYMTEAVEAFTRVAFGAGMYRVWATCDVANTASKRVLEKAGMTCEGVLRGWEVHPVVSSDPQDAFVLAKLATDGEERHRP